ncbi:hypothetical protein AJ80_01660 [Polytolypa hystricis UAMH7299]|uniref:Ketopantoate reductase C-terminal domain-containing protein n=1 Tax=Polytolypa hystricis (strain UAMH7299) TaxID=1447883 RepID=A0A2B7YRR4_POLH7|nr:hypothetical protein AJ80_01660 [Polytolypa hystricis UAMH7299]
MRRLLILRPSLSRCVPIVRTQRLRSLRLFSTPSGQTQETTDDVGESKNEQITSFENSFSKRIHILGQGNVANFIASSLASLPSPPPVTLMLHTQKLYEQFKANDSQITVHESGVPRSVGSFETTLLREGVWYSPPPLASPEGFAGEESDPNDRLIWKKKNIIGSPKVDDSQIEHLIVASTPEQAVLALKSVRDRLSALSTVLFVQGGLFLEEEVNKKVFPDPRSRPNYVVSNFSHFLYRIKPFEIVHKRVGTMTLSILSSNELVTASEKPDQQEERSILQPDTKPGHALAESSVYLLRVLTSCPDLTATTTTKTQILQYQLEKLAISAVNHTLATLVDCANGELLYNFYISRVQRLLLIEISTVICALPELQGVPGLRARFSPERLRRLAVTSLTEDPQSEPKMLRYSRRGGNTGIGYTNGYFVRRGEELGIHCALNYMVLQLVHGKGNIYENRDEEYAPIMMR